MEVQWGLVLKIEFEDYIQMTLGEIGFGCAVITAVVFEILPHRIDDFSLRRIAQRLAVEIIHRNFIQKFPAPARPAFWRRHPN